MKKFFVKMSGPVVAFIENRDCLEAVFEFIDFCGRYFFMEVLKNGGERNQQPPIRLTCNKRTAD